ncbi:MAG: protein kinase [Deltaproteobacteria bacterium]|nr:protein kinase [Deltaproteobacteria bacterium]
MAEIHLAKQRGLQGFEKLVVIKMILPTLAAHKSFVQMFLDEARLAAQLNHPHVVQIYDLGHAEGSYFIAMEYIRGENLRTIIRESRKQAWAIPLAHAVKIISQACEGLHYAHTRTDPSGAPLRIVHRDISPQNILLSFEGVVKIVDFGIAKAATQFTETRAGVLKGKYAYMSPEQVLSEPVDARSDIFSLGVVLWEMVCGKRLFKRASELLTLKAVTEDRVTPPRELRPELPQELEAIILKALAREPAERFIDALQMHLALEAFMKRADLSSSAVHLGAFMKARFAAKLESLRKIESAQAAGDSLESILFDDLTQSSTGSIGTSPVEDLVVELPPGTSERAVSPLEQVQTQPHDAVPSARSRRARPWGWMLAALLLAGGCLAFFLYGRAGLDGRGNPGTAADAGAIGHAPQPGPAGAPADAGERDAGRSGPDGGEQILVTAPPDRSPASRPATLLLRSRPQGARFELDGKPVQGSKLRLQAGRTVQLTASLEGCEPWSERLRLRPGERRTIVARLSPAAPAKAVLHLESTPAADVYIDGKKVGRSPISDLEIEPGTHRVRLVDKALHVSHRLTVRARAGERTEKKIELGQGTLKVRARPWAHVYLGTEKLGTTPFPPMKLYEGRYKLRLVNPQLQGEQLRTVELRSGEMVSVEVDFLK